MFIGKVEVRLFLQNEIPFQDSKSLLWRQHVKISYKQMYSCSAIHLLPLVILPNCLILHSVFGYISSLLQLPGVDIMVEFGCLIVYLWEKPLWFHKG